jgi:hypothetical protein
MTSYPNDQGMQAGATPSYIVPNATGGMTTAAVTTSSSQVLAANPNRRRLSFIIAGTSPVWLWFGSTAATVNAGIPLNQALLPFWNELATGCWLGAVQAISTGTSSVTIIEG